MTDFKFDPDDLIVLNARIKSRLATVAALLVFDTGASSVVLPWRLALAIGLKIDTDNPVRTTTATTVETVPRVIIPEVSVFGKTVENVEAIVKDLPPEAPDGLLGLSFLKHFKLTIDFKKGLLSLE